MKKIVFFAVALFCLWQTPHAAASDQMDYLSIENRIQDEWVDYTYSYPQITRGESRVTEQRLNGFLREYSQSTALNARLKAKGNHGSSMEKQPLQSSEMISISSALYFPLAAKANSCKKALFFCPKTAYNFGWRICFPRRISLLSWKKKVLNGAKSRESPAIYLPCRTFI